MKRILLLLSIAFSTGIYGQNLMKDYEKGNFFDINQNLIDGFFDFDYEPEKSLSVSFTIGAEYTPGYYYDKKGKKVEGLLKYSQYDTYFKYKSNEKDIERIIEPGWCNGYVIGVDSFAVIQDFDVQRELISSYSDKREFAEVIEKFEGYTFYKHTRVGMNNIVTTYIVKLDSVSSFASFPKGSEKFKEFSKEIFGSFDALSRNIQSGLYQYTDIPVMIKLFKYYINYNQQKKIYFNSSWDETHDFDGALYYAVIDSIKGQIFYMSYYFIDDIKIYEGAFTSFYPHKRRGDFIFYHLNGSPRKIISYSNNKPGKVTEFYTNGETHKLYEIKEGKVHYNQIFDLNGQSALNELGSGTDFYFDSIRKMEIAYEYVNHKLINVYYVNENDVKTYQLCERNASFKRFKQFQSKIGKELKYPLESVKLNNNGFILVKCVIEPTGFVSELQVIKGIDDASNDLIINFLSIFKGNAYWAPGRIAGEKVRQEIVLPINFSIQGFSRYRTNNNLWMHQQMMRPPITAPPTIRF